MSSIAQLQALLAVALPVRDILERRVDSARSPEWCVRRGWSDFLLALSESELHLCEARGLGSVVTDLPGAPPELVQLARDTRAVTALPRLKQGRSLAALSLDSVKLRKRGQLEGLLGAVASMAEHAERIVDVGAGSGHFTRLSAELFRRSALGLEQNPERVERARRLAPGELVNFRTVDAREALDLSERDLAIGLHACGELGDKLVEGAARARCDLALVSCCLQKISRPTRLALSRAAEPAELRKEHLGLTNLTARAQGVEASIEVTLAARQTRYALGCLLRERGVALEAGAEMQGINRRRANAGLAEVAERALRLRGLPAASEAELRHHEARATHEYGLIRRLSLPRSMLARLVEVLVSLDRAAHLEERGQRTFVATLFPRRISPRNIAIFASRALSRLPTA